MSIFNRYCSLFLFFTIGLYAQTNDGSKKLVIGATLNYNELNTTGKTRMSMDYRILPVNYYPKEESFSYSTKTKFVDGGYYKFMSVEK